MAVFIVIAFFGIMAHVNRMVFGAPASAAPEPGSFAARDDRNFATYLSVAELALVLAAMPVLVLGVYVPKPLQDLLTMAAAALTR